MENKIRQCYISQGVKFFQNVFTNSHDLTVIDEKTYNIESPCIFFGCYNGHDLRVMQAHKGFGILVWTGTDVRIQDMVEATRQFTNIQQIAISKWADGRLTRSGIEHVYIPYFPMTHLDQYESCTLGDKIYCYAPSELYGKSKVLRIMNKIDYEVILVDDPMTYSKEELREIYKQCFLGLRLTVWDGSAATVQELGLMGRKTIWNGGTLTAIPWDTEESIIENIRQEAKFIGKKRDKLSKQLRGKLLGNTAWLYPDYYKDLE